MKIDNDQLTRKVFEYCVCNIDHPKWSGIVNNISEKFNLEEVIVKGDTFDLKLLKEKLF